MIQQAKDAVASQFTGGAAVTSVRLILVAGAALSSIQAYGIPGWVESIPASPKDGYVGMPGFFMPLGDCVKEWAGLLGPMLTTYISASGITNAFKNGKAVTPPDEGGA